MIKSMTGYGKAEVSTENDKYLIEIRSLNGKNCDINIKNSLIPRDKEMEVRQFIAEKLFRGSIDLFISLDSNSTSSLKRINEENFRYYYNKILDIRNELKIEEKEPIISTVLRIPDVIDSKKQDLTEQEWSLIFKGITDATADLDSFRINEGSVLMKDISECIAKIHSLSNEVERYEGERVEMTRERLFKKLEDLEQQYDENRLEQEMIYYLEKLDINEEKVRLRQHCNYFLETIDQEQYPGKKLNFIAQEIGREINTMGSKANHAEIQKLVIMMKNELEKIKEQTLNIL